MRARVSMAVLAAAVSAVATASADTLTLTPSKDATLYEDPTGSLANGSGPGLFIGSTEGASKRRSLLAFDFSGLPAGATINSAALTLNANKGFSAAPANLYRVLANWGEGASIGGGSGGGAGGAATPGDSTWLHTFYDTSFWATAGGDFAGTASSTTTPAVGPFTFTGAQLAADVQNWKANPATNFGWIVLGDETTAGSALRLDSRESATVESRPMLVINFSVSGGAAAWNVDASGTWSSAGNWSGGVPNSASTPVTFGPAIHANRTVTVDGSFATGGMTFDNAGSSYTLAGSGPVSVSGPLLVANGSHTIGAAVALNGPVTIAAGASLKLAGAVSGHATALTVGTNGKLDLTNRSIVVDYSGGTSPASALIGLLATGAHDGKWDGNGITSSAAAGLPGSALGIFDSGTAVTIKYTLYGDTDLNGVVDQADFNRLKAGMQSAQPGAATWQQGDLNYDRTVNADDVALFDLGAALGTLPGAGVPEPGAVGIVAGVCAIALRGRRRR